VTPAFDGVSDLAWVGIDSTRARFPLQRLASRLPDLAGGAPTSDVIVRETMARAKSVDYRDGA
jgi:hypothetical protein